MTAAGFVAAFPEFAQTNTDLPAYVQSKLDHAAHHVDELVWGDRYAYGVYLKAAHLLAMSPYGENMRLSKTSKETVYGEMFKDELRALPARVMIV